MNRILLVDLGERELKKRNELRAMLSELGGLDPDTHKYTRYILVDLGETLTDTEESSAP